MINNQIKKSQLAFSLLLCFVCLTNKVSGTGLPPQKTTSLILRLNDSALLPLNDSVSLSSNLNAKFAQFNVEYFKKIYSNENLGNFYGDLFYLTCSDTSNGFDTLIIDSLKKIDGIYGVVLLNKYVYTTGCASPITINDAYLDQFGNTLDWNGHSAKWHLDGTDAYCGWKITKGDPDSSFIAIIEGFVDINHPDLNGKVISSQRVPASQLPLNLSYTNYQGNHGTEVFGTAVAKTDDNLGIASTGFRLKAAHYEYIQDGSNVEPLSAVLSILNAAKDGYKVINASFTNIFYAASSINGYKNAEDFLRSLVERKVTMVLSSGNGSGQAGGKYEFTATIPGVIVVGGIGEDYKVDLDQGPGVKLFAIGSHVDIYAPANFILTTTKRPSNSGPGVYA